MCHLIATIEAQIAEESKASLSGDILKQLADKAHDAFPHRPDVQFAFFRQLIEREKSTRTTEEV